MTYSQKARQAQDVGGRVNEKSRLLLGEPALVRSLGVNSVLLNAREQKKSRTFRLGLS